MSGRAFAQLLASYESDGIPARDELYEDLLECVCGGHVYDSAYAAAPHLARLSARASPLQAAIMLGFSAEAVAGARQPGSPAVDPLLAPGAR